MSAWGPVGLGQRCSTRRSPHQDRMSAGEGRGRLHQRLEPFGDVRPVGRLKVRVCGIRAVPAVLDALGPRSARTVQMCPSRTSSVS